MGASWGYRNIDRLTLIHFGAIFGAWIATELEHRELMTPYAIDMAERSLAAIAEDVDLEGLVGERAAAFRAAATSTSATSCWSSPPARRGA